MVQNVQISPQPSSPPLEQHQPQVDPKFDPFPSSLIVSSSLCSSLLGESIDSSNQEAKNKKKGNKKKKQNKQGGNQATIATHATIMNQPLN